MNIEKIESVGPARITIAFERRGDPAASPVLLVMGGGAQLIHWPDGFCDELVARGCYVIRFDNRDSGESSHFPDGPTPNIGAAMAGDTSSASYDLADMAADAVGLLDALGLDSAHVVGSSMGGMIAQMMALQSPRRVRTLTLMSTTTNMPKPKPEPETFANVGPQPQERDAFIEWTVRAQRAIGSPGPSFDEAGIRQRAALAFDRGHDPAAFFRHALAALATGDRTERLRTLRIPTLIIHGEADRMCDVSEAHAAAAVIPHAQLAIYESMGHDIPRPLWPALAARISRHINCA
jgi:pimeloyl-ACP methyl ester carboxylesterase